MRKVVSIAMYASNLKGELEKKREERNEGRKRSGNCHSYQKNVILRLINLYERGITPFLNLLSVMGGVSYLQPRMQNFREKEFNALGRGIGNSRIRPVIHVRKKSNASMPWERKTPKPFPPLPPPKSSYAIVQLPWIPHLANEGGCRLIPSNPAPVPTDPRELPHG